MRDGNFPPPSEEITTQVAIVGGGIAGLAAARRLQARSAGDFLLLELEPHAGGNSACGGNAVSAFPWGAHYLPLANEESTEVLALLGELGVMLGRDAAGVPIYDETMLCADPEERLFDFGRWSEGLLPQLSLTTADREQYARFFSMMEAFRRARGRDGRRAFAIPVDRSSRDGDFLALDAMNMAAWLAGNRFDSAPLCWFVDYCCRDDFGAGAAQVSAWAGVHYFASRDARAANAPRDAVLTWPEGNGWLMKRIAAPLAGRIRTGCVTFRIEPRDGDALVDFFDTAAGSSFRIRAKRVICAAPRFIAQRIVQGIAPVGEIEYSPWMVANITLDGLPAGRGVPLAWDNVDRGGRSLGYIVATHQRLESVPQATVLTHYWPLDDLPPREARQRALGTTHAGWSAQIAAELSRAHPGIEDQIRRIDVWLWGHGMIRPVPGFLWGAARAQMGQPLGPVHFAHSDMSGISIFEEAYTRGCTAADAVLASLS